MTNYDSSPDLGYYTDDNSIISISYCNTRDHNDDADQSSVRIKRDGTVEMTYFLPSWSYLKDANMINVKGLLQFYLLYVFDQLFLQPLLRRPEVLGSLYISCCMPHAVCWTLTELVPGDDSHDEASLLDVWVVWYITGNYSTLSMHLRKSTVVSTSLHLIFYISPSTYTAACYIMQLWRGYLVYLLVQVNYVVFNHQGLACSNEHVAASLIYYSSIVLSDGNQKKTRRPCPLDYFDYFGPCLPNSYMVITICTDEFM